MGKSPPKTETLPPILHLGHAPRVVTVGVDEPTRTEIERLLRSAPVSDLPRGDLAAICEAIVVSEADLVVLDLAGSDDFQLVSQLKLLPDTHFVPLIATAASHMRAHAYSCGADHVMDRPLTAPPQAELFVVRAESLMRSAALSRALRSSRQELRMRRDWVRYLVHDLRNLLSTPLAQIALVTRGRAPDEEERREMLLSIEKDLWKASSLLDDLLDVDRIRKGVVTLRRVDVDLVALAGRVAEAHREQAARGSVAIEVRAQAPGLAAPLDEGLVERVLSNLMSNALRYAPPDTSITIEVGSADGAALLKVVNRGPSIPAERAAHIFEPFVRVDDGRPQATGAGLGLAFCRLAVEIHGGRIAVEEPPGGGAAFVLKLPLDDLSESAG